MEIRSTVVEPEVPKLLAAGVSHQEGGRLAEAEACYQSVLAIDADQADALHLLGTVAHQQGHHEQAIELIRRAIRRNDRYPPFFANLGVVLCDHGKFAEAIAASQRAIALEADYVEAYFSLGNALRKSGKLDQAAAALHRAIAIEPNSPGGYVDVGVVLREQRKLAEAAEACRQALEIDPDLATARTNLGAVLRDGGDTGPAVACFRLALASKPDYAKAWSNLGVALKDQGRLDDAIVCYRRALLLDPNYAAAHSNLLFCLNYHPWMFAEEIFAEYRRWDERHARKWAPALVNHDNLPGPERRLRVGYVSPDFRRHSARHFIEPLLAHHDKEQVEVFAYAEVMVEDEHSARFRDQVDHWLNTVGMIDSMLTERIASDRIDILVDLAGHTNGNRLLVFARKPAPIQVSALGYGYTTGLSAIDYFLTDTVCAPPDCEHLFAEKLVRLPVFATYQAAPEMGESGALPVLSRGSINFGSFTRSVRVNARVVSAWAAILRGVPGSRLVINSLSYGDPGMRHELVAQFAPHGIAADRLTIGYDTPPWDALRQIDITLDCFPHNSGTTLFESLYLGVPFITLAGRPSVGRIGAAILNALGHPEWIATSEQEYVAKAITLAERPERLATLRAGLRGKMQASRLMQGETYAHSVEDAYRAMWRRWCAGDPPSAITVPGSTFDTLENGVMHHQAGRLGEAAGHYRQVLAGQPEHAVALHLLGVVEHQSGRHGAAVELILEAIRINDQDPTFFSNLGNALKSLDRHAEAVTAFRRAIALEPAYAEAYYNLGNTRRNQGRDDEAIASYRHATALRPSLAAAHASLGSVFTELGRLDEAEATYRDAIVTKPDFSQARINLGVLLQMRNRLDEAIDECRRAIAIAPDLADAYAVVGNALKDQGRTAGALAAYRRAILIKPDYSTIYSNLGVLLAQEGKLEAAEVTYRQAIALQPDLAEAYANLGNTLQDQSRVVEAISAYRVALLLKPLFAEAHSSFGNALRTQGMLDQAVSAYRQAIAVRPDLTVAHSNLGNALRDQDKLGEALVAYRNAIILGPDYAEAYSNLGVTLREMEKPEEAAIAYWRAIAIKPDLPEAHSNLGVALRKAGKMDEAVAACRRAVVVGPDHATTYCNFGVVLADRDEFSNALSAYRRAILLRPDYAAAHYNRGNLYSDMGDYAQAMASHRRALIFQPDHVEAEVNLCVPLKMSHRYCEALLCAERALLIDPEYALAHQATALMLAHLSDYSDVTRHSDAALAGSPGDPDVWEGRLYMFSYHPDLRAQEIYAEFVRWGDQFPCPTPNTWAAHERGRVRRLRVGYVSPDFRRHTSRFFFEPLFSHHDRALVELFAYSNVKHEDSDTVRFKTLFDHWRDIRGMSDERAAEMVRSDGIDILVDACNHMDEDRLDVFVHKPAPIQVTWLGAAWTTGLPMVDYVLFDKYMAPEGTLTRENIVRLPGCFVAYRPPAVTAAVAPLPALERGHVTFGYSGRTERLNHRTFRSWAEILRRLPDARLVLDFPVFADPQTQGYYRVFLARHGIDIERVDMRRSENIFEGLCDIDILLDCFPHSGGTMLFDALWMGVPFVTLASRPPVGRIGTSLLSNLGLFQWIAHNEDKYVETVIDRARDLDSLGALRETLRERMRQSPLMDEHGFARGVEAAYLRMWQRWCADEPPSPLASIES